jgi:hypothetical protein
MQRNNALGSVYMCQSFRDQSWNFAFCIMKSSRKLKSVIIFSLLSRRFLTNSA